MPTTHSAKSTLGIGKRRRIIFFLSQIIGLCKMFWTQKHPEFETFCSKLKTAVWMLFWPFQKSLKPSRFELEVEIFMNQILGWSEQYHVVSRTMLDFNLFAQVIQFLVTRNRRWEKLHFCPRSMRILLLSAWEFRKKNRLSWFLRPGSYSAWCLWFWWCFLFCFSVPSSIERDGPRTGWPRLEMCKRPEWKSCCAKMHWMRAATIPAVYNWCI